MATTRELIEALERRMEVSMGGRIALGSILAREIIEKLKEIDGDTPIHSEIIIGRIDLGNLGGTEA